MADCRHQGSYTQEYINIFYIHRCFYVSVCNISGLSPAVIVWPNSIKAGILFEWVAAFLPDEVGIPVQTLFAFNRHAHHTTVKFSILFVTVVWPSRQKENTNNRILTERCVVSGQWRDCGVEVLPTSQKLPLYPSGQEHWKLECLRLFMQVPPF